MSESMRMWAEISFNLAYLIAIWGLVIAMYRRRKAAAEKDSQVARIFLGMFALLALGDTGHVGFRVWAYALGDMGASLNLFGLDLGLVGLGALATAITVTFFYMLLVVVWQKRFDRSLKWAGWGLLAVGVIRLLIMLAPANEWNRVVPAQPWSLYRNIPLMVQGLGIAVLILRDALKAGDRSFLWVSIWVFVSYAFYMPVIFWVQQVPVLGMLMIPKTLAYVAVAVLAYNKYFRRESAATLQKKTATAA